MLRFASFLDVGVTFVSASFMLHLGTLAGKVSNALKKLCIEVMIVQRYFTKVLTWFRCRLWLRVNVKGCE